MLQEVLVQITKFAVVVKEFLNMGHIESNEFEPLNIFPVIGLELIKLKNKLNFMFIFYRFLISVVRK